MTDRSGVSPRPRLPAQARHEAAARLIATGLYHEAQGLLSIEEPDDAELGMQASLLAGDPRTAAKFLGRLMMASAARAGEVELVRGCIALASGHDEALATTRQELDRMDPTDDDWSVFAVTAAPHDLGAAAEAATHVLGPVNPAVLAVLAASRAVDGDALGAHRLLEAAGNDGVGDDPARRTADLLKTHHHETALQELDAARWHRRSPVESVVRRMGSWRRRRTDRDLRCRCAGTPVWAGASSRYYVDWHLELIDQVGLIDPTDQTGPMPDDWRILFCAQSGVRYLDRASIPVSVRIGTFREPLDQTY